MLWSHRRQGHAREPAEPSGDGAAGSRHDGAMALAVTCGERGLGNPSVPAALCCVPGTSQPGRRACVLGTWAEEVNLLQRTKTSLLKYLPARQLLVARGELPRCCG